VARYNAERPHQALAMKVAAEVCTRSPRVCRGLEDLRYPFHDATFTVSHCGRICFHGRKINLTHALAGQNVGVTQLATRSGS
jgi:putative transposase